MTATLLPPRMPVPVPVHGCCGSAWQCDSNAVVGNREVVGGSPRNHQASHRFDGRVCWIASKTACIVNKDDVVLLGPAKNCFQLLQDGGAIVPRAVPLPE